MPVYKYVLDMAEKRLLFEEKKGYSMKKIISEFGLLIAFIAGLVIGFNFGRTGVSMPAVLSPDIFENTVVTKAVPTAAPAVSKPTGKPTGIPEKAAEDFSVEENGEYDTRDEVALYIHTYGHLPYNYVTRASAKKAGWEGGSLESIFPGSSIGGDIFRNREGLLPKKSGRTYYECDIEATGKKSRGPKRIVFSDDGLIYYTDDHYESFTLLYGRP